MGYSYDMRGRLCCDSCDNSGNVRKYKCPFGYCQALALCCACAKTHKSLRSKEHHRERGCEKYHNEFVASQALRLALLQAGKSVRCAALDAPPYGVHVLFQTMDGTTEGFYMAKETYHVIPLGNPATPDDYRQHGTLTPAPSDFNFTAA